MHHQDGVRTVAVGGKPDVGAMQVPSGTRGAELYSSADLDSDMENAININTSVKTGLPDRDVDFFITYAGFNLKDSVRKGDNMPLQFTYEAADCRIFYTLNTVYNYQNLWNYVVDAIWRNPSLCIAGSKEYAGSTNTDTTGPSGSQKQQWASVQPNSVGALILNGLNYAQNSPSLGKREYSSSSNILKRKVAGEDQGDPQTTQEIEDDSSDPTTCQSCKSPYQCAKIPVCDSLGDTKSWTYACKKTCKQKLATSNYGCGDPNKYTCVFENDAGTQGFCDTLDKSDIYSNCIQYPEMDTKDLEKHPSTSVSANNFQYALPGSSGSHYSAQPISGSSKRAKVRKRAPSRMKE